jgi:hypothetical protein
MPRSLTAFMAISLRRDGLTTFFKRLRHNLGLEFILKVQFLEPPVFFLKFFHTGHHGYVNTAIFGSQFVKGGSADAHFSANIRYSKANFNALHSVHDLAIGEI